MRQIKQLKKDLDKLILDCRLIEYHESIIKERIDEDFAEEIKESTRYKEFRKSQSDNGTAYQQWYTVAARLVKQILPERLEEFKALYRIPNVKLKDLNSATYGIGDYFMGVTVTRGYNQESVVNSFSTFCTKIRRQRAIVDSCASVLDSRLSDIASVLQFELFETELEAAKDLLKKKYDRAAGALAGVTLEIHLSTVCMARGIKFRKANPTISNFNEALKNDEVIDVPTWRLIQRLGDIRNLSVHSKERAPTSDEVSDLIRGTEKLIAELN